MSISSVTQKGQVTVPAPMRAALGLKAGSKVIFSRQGKKLILEAFREQPVESIFGTFRVIKGRGVPDLDVALESLRHERATRRASVHRRSHRKDSNR